MKTIVIDPGHGGIDPGSSYNGNLEKNFNLSIALNVREALKKRYNVNVIMTRETDKTISLSQRTDFANSHSADFYLSIHINAGGGTGFESYIYNGSVSSQTITYQKIIHTEVINAVKNKYHITDRGQKRANYHVLRETKMPSILLENLFIDTARDLSLLKNTAFIIDLANGIATGAAKVLALPSKAPAAVTSLYKVYSGSFQNRDNAEQRVRFLAAKGFKSFIVPASISGMTYYRVQTRSFSTKENADQQIEALKRTGITDVFVIAE